MPFPRFLSLHYSLTDAEREVLRLVACGHRDADVARAASLAPRVVRARIERFRDRCDLGHRRLVVWSVLHLECCVGDLAAEMRPEEILVHRPATSGQVTCLALLSEGCSDAEIAAGLGASEAAVKARLRRFARGTGLSGRGLAAWCAWHRECCLAQPWPQTSPASAR